MGKHGTWGAPAGRTLPLVLPHLPLPPVLQVRVQLPSVGVREHAGAPRPAGGGGGGGGDAGGGDRD